MMNLKNGYYNTVLHYYIDATKKISKLHNKNDEE